MVGLEVVISFCYFNATLKPRSVEIEVFENWHLAFDI